MPNNDAAQTEGQDANGVRVRISGAQILQMLQQQQQLGEAFNDLKKIVTDHCTSSAASEAACSAARQSNEHKTELRVAALEQRVSTLASVQMALSLLGNAIAAWLGMRAKV